jgi:hypothetical protein
MYVLFLPSFIALTDWLACFMLFLLYLGTYLITIGALSVDTCHGEPLIPWWLILQGVLHVVYVLFKVRFVVLV